jgi:glycosyltransferase involved in cell wall biosynthesis
VRVLLATPYFAPAYAFGGSVTVGETVVEGVIRAGHEAVVVTTDVLDERARAPRPGPQLPDGARVERFPNVSHRLAAGANVYLPRGLRGWLRSHIRSFDVVLLHDLYSAVSVTAARAARDARVPYALQPLGTASPARERGRPIAKRAFLAAWGRRTVRDARAVLHATEHEANELRAIGAQSPQLVRMPLPLDLPRDSTAQRTQRPTVAYVGRLHPIKRIDRLIEAVAVVHRTMPDVVLEIVGPGDRHAAELRALAARLGIEDAVRFRGYVSVEEKLRVLSAAQVFALLSMGEGLPMAALEAMACGTPVVLSEACHFPEVHERGGLVVPGDASDAAVALERLLRDERERDAMGAGARELAATFRRETVMPQMVSALERLAR